MDQDEVEIFERPPTPEYEDTTLLENEGDDVQVDSGEQQPGSEHEHNNVRQSQDNNDDQNLRRQVAQLRITKIEKVAVKVSAASVEKNKVQPPKAGE